METNKTFNARENIGGIINISVFICFAYLLTIIICILERATTYFPGAFAAVIASTIIFVIAFICFCVYRTEKGIKFVTLLYFLSAVISLIFSIIIIGRYIEYAAYYVCVLLLPAANIACCVLLVTSHCKGTIGEKGIVFAFATKEKRLAIKSIEYIERGMFSTITIKSPAKKITLGFIDDMNGFYSSIVKNTGITNVKTIEASVEKSEA